MEFQELKEGTVYQSRDNGSMEYVGINIDHGKALFEFKMSNGKTLAFEHFCNLGLTLDIEPTYQDQPTEDGYYWLEGPEEQKSIVEVVMHEAIYNSDILFCGMAPTLKLKDITGKWYGPITPPKED